MNTPDSPGAICAYYSRGPHFRRVLQELRTAYPDARLIALLPPGYPSAVIRDLVDAYEFTQHKQYRGRQIGALYRLRRQIRQHRPDLFVVMFDSPRLRLLGALTGIRERYCISSRGHWRLLRVSPHHQAFSSLLSRIAGTLRYHWVRFQVLHRPVRSIVPPKQNKE